MPNHSFQDLINGDKPVLVDFTATWCGPCKMQAPILKELKDQVQDSVTIIKIDVDKNPQAAQAYQVQGVPTLIVFQKGQILWRKSGVSTAKELKQVLDTKTQAL